MYSLRFSVALVMLMVCVAFTAVGSSRNSRDGIQERGTPELAISDEQRGYIFEIVMRILRMRPLPTGRRPRSQMRCQNECQCRIVPAEVSQEVPLVQDHKFVKFDDRILIVHPSSRLVVAMIPRYKLMP